MQAFFAAESQSDSARARKKAFTWIDLPTRFGFDVWKSMFFIGCATFPKILVVRGSWRLKYTDSVAR